MILINHMSTIKPLGEHVLVRPKKKEEKTSFGLVLPDTVDEKKKAEGEVVAVGPGRLLEDGKRTVMQVKVGDYVIYKSWGGDEVKMGDEEMKILTQDDILAVVEK